MTVRSVDRTLPILGRRDVISLGKYTVGDAVIITPKVLRVDIRLAGVWVWQASLIEKFIFLDTRGAVKCYLCETIQGQPISAVAIAKPPPP